MADEQSRSSTVMSGPDPLEELQFEREMHFLLSVRCTNTTERLAKANVAYRNVSEALLKVEADLKGREHQRSVAHHALMDAIEIIVRMHSKTAPSHGGGMNGKCKSCEEIRRLKRQVTVSERLPDSRMALAS